MLPIMLAWAAVSGSYYFSKMYVQETRLKKEKAATALEIVPVFICSTIIMYLIALFATRENGGFVHNNTTYARFAVLSISSFWGLWSAYEIDNRLTKVERNLRRFKAEKEQRKEQIDKHMRGNTMGDV